MNLFGRKTAKQQVKESQKDLKDNIRELERDMMGLKREEIKLTADIRAAANSGNDASTRVLAKEMVRLRGQMTRLQVTMAGLRGVGTTLSTATSSSAMTTSLQKAGVAMAAVGKKIDPLESQQQAKLFAKQCERQELAQAMMDDGLEGALASEDLEGQSNLLVQQMLDEVGVEFASKMQPVPVTVPVAPPRQTAGVAEVSGEDDELANRLAALRAA